MMARVHVRTFLQVSPFLVLISLLQSLVISEPATPVSMASLDVVLCLSLPITVPKIEEDPAVLMIGLRPKQIELRSENQMYSLRPFRQSPELRS